MSPKELNYVEDALGHEKFLRTKCDDTAAQLTDPDLKQFAQQMSTQHQQLFQQFFNLV